MEKNYMEHLRVLELPKQLLWTDRNLNYFLDEMSADECRMNKYIYRAFFYLASNRRKINPADAFNLAYYECVRISLARNPEDENIFEMLEIDIIRYHKKIDYGFTDLVMNMVWVMLHTTNTDESFAEKLIAYLKNYGKQNNQTQIFVARRHPSIMSPGPLYKVTFTPQPEDIDYKEAKIDWEGFTNGYQENLIEELVALWPKKKRSYIRECIQTDRMKRYSINIRDLGSTPIRAQDDQIAKLNTQINSYEEQIRHLQNLCDEWKNKYARQEQEIIVHKNELDSYRFKYLKQVQLVHKMQEDIIRLKATKANTPVPQEPEKAFNQQTERPCFTSRQMGVMMLAVGIMTEQKPPGKTTIGPTVESIAGYGATTVSANMKGIIRQADKDVVANALESKYPNLAAQVRKL